jgi:twitching motility protein PilT
MSLVPSLLQAIVRVDGDAMVMHAGDKPYVVAPSGQVELASRGLTLDAVNGIVGQLLPAEIQHALEEFGAIQYELPALPEFPSEHFTVVAARGGDDVWVEIRRRRVADEDRVPDEYFPPPAPIVAETSVAPAHIESTATPQTAVEPAAPAAEVPQEAPEPEPEPIAAQEMPAPAAVEAPLVVMKQPEVEPHVVVDAIDEPILPPAAQTVAEVAAARDEEPIDIEDDDLALPDEMQLFGRPVTAFTDQELAEHEGHEIDLDADLDASDDVEIASAIAASPAAVVRAPEPQRPSEPPAPPPVAVAAPPVAVVPPPVAVAPPPPVAVAPRQAPVVAAPPPAPRVVEAAVPKVPPIVRETATPPPPARVVVEAPPAPVVASAPAPAPPASVAARAPEPSPPPAPAVASMPPRKPHVAPTPAPLPAPHTAASIEAPRSRVVEPVVAPPQPRAVEPIAAQPPPVAPPVAAPAARAVSPRPRIEVPPPVSYAIEREEAAAEPPQPAVVLPISRSPIRPDQPPPAVSEASVPGLDRLLRLASARGASTLYLSSDSRPSARVDGELQMLDAEPVHTPRDVESLLLTLMPERNHEALRTGALTEWICDIEGVGRVRCMSFRDHRGPGGVFRLMPTRSVSVEQLGLPRHVQALAIEPEGLVLVAGPRSSGKRTLMAAFVDLMNRTRRDHIITIEREINIVHEGGHSFISQREVRGDDDELLAAARGALREDPDVLVIEDLRTGPLMNVALEAAASGHLVVGGFAAHTATGAIDRIIDLYAPEYRRQVQFAIADSLRGVIAQVLLRKIGGGRLPAREVLLNTPAVSSVIAEGKTSQLPMAIEGGRRYGMVPLNDALVGLVQSGAVEAREAYRQSPDRPGFLAALARQGLDTSFVERLA